AAPTGTTAAPTGTTAAPTAAAALPPSAEKKASDAAAASGNKLFEPEKASVLSTSGLAAPQAAAVPLMLADAQPTPMPGPEPASLSVIGAAPPAKDAPGPPPLADAAVPSISEGEKASPLASGSPVAAAEEAPAADPVPPDLALTEAPALPLATEGAPPASSESGTKVEIKSPEAPALAGTAPPAASPPVVTLEPGIDLENESPGITAPPAEAPPLASHALPDALPGDPTAKAAEPPSIAEAGTVESVVALEATAPRPPSGVSAAQGLASGTAVASSRAAETAGKAPSAAVASPEPAKKIPTALEAPAKPSVTTSLFVEKLKSGAYYVQVGVYNSDATLTAAAGRFGSKFPMTAEKLVGKSGTQYRLYVGPIARDESGIMVIRIKSLGFRDAFLRKAP
ncbi:MAG: SPOR domain-containing protein, partial [Rectinemataceae bacterium]